MLTFSWICLTEQMPSPPASDFECPFPKFHAPSLNVNDSFEKVVAKIMNSIEDKLLWKPLFKLNAFYLSSGDSFEEFVAQITHSNDKKTNFNDKSPRWTQLSWIWMLLILNWMIKFLNWAGKPIYLCLMLFFDLFYFIKKIQNNNRNSQFAVQPNVFFFYNNIFDEIIFNLR